MHSRRCGAWSTGRVFLFVNANIKRMINNLAKAGNNVRFLGDNGSMQRMYLVSEYRRS